MTEASLGELSSAWRTSPPALLLVDVQRGFDDPVWGPRNNPDAEDKIDSLVIGWRKLELPIIHVRHGSVVVGSPLRPETPGWEFKNCACPESGEQVFEKKVHSAFIGTGLAAFLRSVGVESLCVAGFTTDHCVSTTVRMGHDLGHRMVLVEDAAATFDRVARDGRSVSAAQVHEIHLASLRGEFCAVVSARRLRQLVMGLRSTPADV